MALVKKFLKEAEEIQKRHHQNKLDERPKSHADDESNWLVSYADMMTLLCGFFIMLFSMAKIDDTQYERVKEGIAKEFKGDYETPSSTKIAEFAHQIIKDAGIEKDTLITSDPNGVTIAFQSTVFFETLSSEVSPQGKVVLDKLIESLSFRQKQDQKEYKIIVEGHTDSRPVLGGVFPSNWELSGARASRVVRIFLDHGYTPKKLTAIAYGDTRPLVEAKKADGTWDDEALSKNRRVVLRILEPHVDLIPTPPSDSESASTAH